MNYILFDEDILTIENMYNLNNHVFVYNKMLNDHCKYCNCYYKKYNNLIITDPNCISDEEKIIKNLLE
jgi:hypothetical protein